MCNVLCNIDSFSFRPRNFELTPECLVFDILNIGLYHGWLIDPQDSQISNAVGNLSYNQLVEKIIESKDKNSSEEIVREGNKMPVLISSPSVLSFCIRIFLPTNIVIVT